jgi:hypothetical protein
MGRTCNTYNTNRDCIQNFDSQNIKGEITLRELEHRRRGNSHINIYVIKIGCGGVKWIT